MTVIGLTGGIASGKSTAAEVLRELGATIIDADRLGHRSYEPGTPGFEKVVNAFGHDIVGRDGLIDRRVLGGKVFGAPGQMERLNAIVWPEIRNLIREEVDQIKGQDKDAIIVLEAAVLLEAGWQDLCDEIWVVTTPVPVAVERLRTRNNLAEDAAMARINAQMSNKERSDAASVKIENAGTEEQLRARVERAWDALVQRVRPSARKPARSVKPAVAKAVPAKPAARPAPAQKAPAGKAPAKAATSAKPVAKTVTKPAPRKAAAATKAAPARATTKAAAKPAPKAAAKPAPKKAAPAKKAAAKKAAVKTAAKPAAKAPARKPAAAKAAPKRPAATAKKATPAGKVAAKPVARKAATAKPAARPAAKPAARATAARAAAKPATKAPARPAARPAAKKPAATRGASTPARGTTRGTVRSTARAARPAARAGGRK